MENDFIRSLERRLREPLPGINAQKLMTPPGVNDERFNMRSMGTAKPSGVLVLLYTKNGEWHLPLTLRQDYEGTHSGQVSFPGGKKEEVDENVVHTALREASEEVGIVKNRVEILGQLTDLYIPPSNFRVTPTLAFATEPPSFVIDSYEVKELIETPLSILLDRNNIKSKVMRFGNGYSADMPYFDVHGHVVWGATAMILSELISIIDD